MSQPFKTVGIISREGGDDIRIVLERLMHSLQRHDCDIILDKKSAQKYFETCPHPCVERTALPDLCDLLVVIGGDGSFLGAARTMVGSKVPVVGVNKGQLGFLTDISPAELENKIAAIMEGRFHIEQRFLLEAFIERDGKEQFIGMSLNDVVLKAGDAVNMIEFEIEVDGKFVSKQRSDGMIIATPTGSTAYALSGGGPIIYPSLEAVVLVPMHPHTLSSRPIVINSNSTIRLEIISDCEPIVSCDGLPAVQVRKNDVIHIRRKKETLPTLHPEDHDFYKACRVKLGWSSHLTK